MADEEQLREIFHNLDEDGSGSLSAQELRPAMMICGWDPTIDELEELIRANDINEDGQFTEDEFVQAMMQMMAHKPSQEEKDQQCQETADIIMQIYDADGSGCISKDELRTFLKEYGREKMTDENVDEMFEIFENFDQDGSGTISRDELVRFMKSDDFDRATGEA